MRRDFVREAPASVKKGSWTAAWTGTLETAFGQVVKRLLASAGVRTEKSVPLVDR